MNQAILLTIDVEDWFQVENFKSWIPFSTWDSRELRVLANTRRLLDLLDSFPGQPVCATFFVLGWIADKLPELIREIDARGHEVASHGYRHDLCTAVNPRDLEADLAGSRKRLEDILGKAVWGYRAPNFSITAGILKMIADAGYRYDSSFNSFQWNKRYGRIDLSRYESHGMVHHILPNFHEIPISNLALPGVRQVFPWGGGGYFRLIPFFLFRQGVRAILGRQGTYVFYMHPWEIDPGQPRVRSAPLSIRFRHYLNLGKTETRLRKMIHSFRAHAFLTCSELVQAAVGDEQ